MLGLGSSYSTRITYMENSNRLYLCLFYILGLRVGLRVRSLAGLLVTARTGYPDGQVPIMYIHVTCVAAKSTRGVLADRGVVLEANRYQL